MALLTKFVYGFETSSKKTPFGFINNQVRIDNIIQNAGWFNINGERLGTGDLTLKDMHVAAKLIPSSEAFFALTEADSGWNVPSNLDQTAPGFAYILQKAVWVVVKTIGGGAVVRVRDDITKAEEIVKDGEKYMRVPRTDIYKAFGIDKTGKPIPPPPPVKKKALTNEEVDAKINAVKSAKTKNTVSPAAPPVNSPIPAGKPTITKATATRKSTYISGYKSPGTITKIGSGGSITKF